jgi:cyclase
MIDAVALTNGHSPVRWLVNTHQHGDHVYGNALLPDSTTIVGHRNMRAGLAADFIFDSCPTFWTPLPEWGFTCRRLPDLTFENSVVVHVGALEVAVHHPGYTAHTDGDVVVHVPERGVLFTGDLLFHGLTPMLLMGSVDGARRSLEWIASFHPSHVIPGHGPLIQADDLDRVLQEHDRYFQLVGATAARGIADHVPPLVAARATDLGEFSGWPDSERLVLNLHKAYADAAGVDVDLVTAMNDAIAWNGGPMRTHL